MIYNPFTEMLDVSAYIDELYITIDGQADYSINYTIDLTVSSTFVSIQLNGRGQNFIKNFDENGLINAQSGGIFLSMRKPPTGYFINYSNVGINPCILKFTGNYGDPEIIETEIRTRKPLNCTMTKDKLILELLQGATQITEAEVIEGISSINGLTPDNSGNINIVSKSPEILISMS